MEGVIYRNNNILTTNDWHAQAKGNMSLTDTRDHTIVEHVCQQNLVQDVSIFALNEVVALRLDNAGIDTRIDTTTLQTDTYQNSYIHISMGKVVENHSEACSMSYQLANSERREMNNTLAKEIG